LRKLQHRLHVLIYPAPDLAGQWVAHCLDLDLVSQGSSATHALEMIAEAVQLSVQWAIEEGRPPLEMRPAPAEEWDRFEKNKIAVTRILHLPQMPSDVVLEPVTIARAL